MSERSDWRRAASELLDSRRLMIVASVLVVEFAIFLAGLLTPVPPATQQSLANSTGSQFAVVNTGGAAQIAGFIFTHNLMIALVEMVPVLGALLFVFSIYVTGLLAQALVAAQGLPGQWGALILAFPYSLVELSAYALSVGAGTMLLVAWRRKTLRLEAKVFVLEVLAMACILLTAAVMETVTIKISPIVGFALWLPTGLALAAIVAASAKRHPRGATAQPPPAQ